MNPEVVVKAAPQATKKPAAKPIVAIIKSKKSLPAPSAPQKKSLPAPSAPPKKSVLAPVPDNLESCTRTRTVPVKYIPLPKGPPPKTSKFGESSGLSKTKQSQEEKENSLPDPPKDILDELLGESHPNLLDELSMSDSDE